MRNESLIRSLLLLWLKKIIKMLRNLLNAAFEKKYDKENVKVKDHCHITGKYKGSAHEECNINLSQTRKISIVL